MPYLRKTYLGDGAGHATPSADDGYWAQVWNNFENAAPWALLGPAGTVYQGVFESVKAATGNEAPDTNIVTQFFADHPDVKQTVKDTTENIISIVPELVALIPNTLQTTNTLIKLLPWLLGAAVLFIFMNPGTLRRA